MKNRSEFGIVIDELREHFNYLGELGLIESPVDSVRPQTLNSKNTELDPMVLDPEVMRTVAPTPSLPPKDIFVPNLEDIKSMRPVEKEPNTSSRKDSLLRKSRLSNLSPKPVGRKRKRDVPEENRRDKEIKSMSNVTGLNSDAASDLVITDVTKELPPSVETLEEIRGDIGTNCERCRLCENRTQVVNSVGNPNAGLMFIGEAPGADEDEKGEPFVGRAGQLLTKIIEAVDLKRENVFIGNINRCRPPANRTPTLEEASICKPFLLREIAVVRPKVIVVLGNTACQNLLETKIGITKLRGSFKDYFGVKVMPTFHPAYLLRDPRKKREVWDDLKMVRDYLAKTENES